MGLLIDGQWHDKWYDTKSTGGRFVRSTASFRGTIEPGGEHPPEAGRYHLYVAWACPWAHRTLLYRSLKGLQDLISVSWVGPDMMDQGWPFDDQHPDDLFGASHLHEIYTRAVPDFTGRVTVPVLWDKKTGTIVNNESSEIIRIFDRAFAGLADPSAPFSDVLLAPDELIDAIDDINEIVYDNVNNGVYKSGFATTQEAYDEAVASLFATLDELERRLGDHRYLLGDRITEADWRLFPTLVRFDAVYHGHFKCSRRQLQAYPNLWAWTRELYQMPGVKQTIHLPETRRHYYYSHRSINPCGIVPMMPDLDFDAPHHRERIGG